MNKKYCSIPYLTFPGGNIYPSKYNGKAVQGMKGFTIAAALHQAGFPVHTHSLDNRNRSLECGIGKMRCLRDAC